METGVGIQNPLFFVGVVENNVDERLEGRVQVRAFGIHGTKDQIATEDLPWATLIIGNHDVNFTVPPLNAWVFGFFLDGRDAQQPMVLGLIPTQMTNTNDPNLSGWGVTLENGNQLNGQGSRPEDFGQPQNSRLSRGEELENTYVLPQEVNRSREIPIAGGGTPSLNSMGNSGAIAQDDTAAGTSGVEGNVGNFSDEDVIGVEDAGAGYTVIRLADGSVVRREGTRAWRNNNPGNIEYGDFARSMGAVGSDGRFAVFPNYEAGRRAKERLLFNTSSYRNLSITGAVNRYAPSFENDTGAYTRSITDDLGLPATTSLSSLSPAQKQTMLDTMERVEGFRVGREIRVSDATETVRQVEGEVESLRERIEKEDINEYDTARRLQSDVRSTRERISQLPSELSGTSFSNATSSLTQSLRSLSEIEDTIGSAIDDSTGRVLSPLTDLRDNLSSSIQSGLGGIQNALGTLTSNANPTSEFSSAVPDAGAGSGSAPPPSPTQRTFEEPSSAYNAEYPYNRVIETSAGHSIEIDDTPGAERIMVWHRSGSYVQMSPSTTTHKSTKDFYEINDQNQHVYVGGTNVVTIMGDSHVLVKGNKIEEIMGDYRQIVHGNHELGVAGQMNINASDGGQIRAAKLNIEANVENVNIKVAKNFRFESGEATHFTSKNFFATVEEATNINSGKVINIQGGEGLNLLTEQIINIQGNEGMNILATEDVNIQTEGSFHFKAGTAMFQEATNSMNIKAGDNFYTEVGSTYNLKTNTMFLEASGAGDFKANHAKIGGGSATSVNSSVVYLDDIVVLANGQATAPSGASGATGANEAGEAEEAIVAEFPVEVDRPSPPAKSIASTPPPVTGNGPR